MILSSFRSSKGQFLSSVRVRTKVRWTPKAGARRDLGGTPSIGERSRNNGHDRRIVMHDRQRAAIFSHREIRADQSRRFVALTTESTGHRVRLQTGLYRVNGARSFGI